MKTQPTICYAICSQALRHDIIDGSCNVLYYILYGIGDLLYDIRYGAGSTLYELLDMKWV